VEPHTVFIAEFAQFVQIINAAEQSMASMSLREPDLSKCLVSKIVRAAIRLKNAPHISIEKYTIWRSSICLTPFPHARYGQRSKRNSTPFLLT
jgi:hypothetical protein